MGSGRGSLLYPGLHYSWGRESRERAETLGSCWALARAFRATVGTLWLLGAPGTGAQHGPARVRALLSLA